MVLLAAKIKAKTSKKKSTNGPTAIVTEATLILRLKSPSQLEFLLSLEPKDNKIRPHTFTRLQLMRKMQM